MIGAPNSNGGKKVFVLDTNILVDDNNVLIKIKDNIAVIAFTVLDELDGLKKRSDELGVSARRMSRTINKLKKNGRSLSKGVPIEDADGQPTGGILYLDNEEGIKNLLPLKTHRDTPDHRIMSVALKWQKPHMLKQHKLSLDTPVILITNDVNLRNKADSFEIVAEWYKTDKVSGYLGLREISDAPLFNLLSDKGTVANNDLKLDYNFLPNECLAIRKGGQVIPAIHKPGKIETIKLPDSIHGITPRNPGQIMAMKLLLDKDISLVTINGKAGTGKTLLALAAALHQLLNNEEYERVAVARPIVTMGNDIGFLPGDIEEKLNPWMQPIYDNLDILFSKDERHKKNTKQRKGKSVGVDISDHSRTETWKSLIEQKLLCVEPLAYIRGRSIPGQILIIDEAQNLNRHEVKTIITRIGEGAKIILTGDTNQIDNPYLNQNNNGLAIVIEKFKTKDCAGHITLKKSERSKLAELAADIL